MAARKTAKKAPKLRSRDNPNRQLFMQETARGYAALAQGARDRKKRNALADTAVHIGAGGTSVKERTKGGKLTGRTIAGTSTGH